MARLIRWARSTAVACVTLMLPVRAGAQSAYTTLVGVVRDTAGRPIPGVEVRLQGGQYFTRTNDSGGFRVNTLPIGETTIAVRRLGFSPSSTQLTLRSGRIDSLVFALNTLAIGLPGVLVEDEYMARSHRFLAGFWDRRARGFGSFVTRDQIERMQAHDFVDLVRMVPSASLVSVNGRKQVRFKRNAGVRDCPPQYWVDGMRVEQATPDEFVPEDTEAIEIYPGPATTPPQFAARPFTYTCGAIVIWTRLPGG